MLAAVVFQVKMILKKLKMKSSHNFYISEICMIKKAILPVAGLGTRFLPASKSIPKEMVTVVDRPAIEYVVK